MNIKSLASWVFTLLLISFGASYIDMKLAKYVVSYKPYAHTLQFLVPTIYLGWKKIHSMIYGETMPENLDIKTAYNSYMETKNDPELMKELEKISNKFPSMKQYITKQNLEQVVQKTMMTTRSQTRKQQQSKSKQKRAPAKKQAKSRRRGRR